MFDFRADQLEETRASYEAHAQAHADATLKQAEKIAATAKVACDSVKLTGDQPYKAIIETSANQIAGTPLQWPRTAGMGWQR